MANPDELDQIKTGAAALGLCIARVLTESDPTTRQRIVEETERMHKHLADHDGLAAVQILSAEQGQAVRPRTGPRVLRTER